LGPQGITQPPERRGVGAVHDRIADYIR
jgi:hypothetical protein